jgi:hypothetical protein
VTGHKDDIVNDHVNDDVDSPTPNFIPVFASDIEGIES